MKHQKFLQKWVERILDVAWGVTALSSVALGLFKLFFDPHNQNAQILTAIGVIGAGFYRAHTKMEKQISAHLAINILPSLSQEDIAYVRDFALQIGQFNRITNEADDRVARVLNGRMTELKMSMRAYSLGRINVPIDESPAVNHDIIETFGERMDAVSRNDVKFWATEMGMHYLKKCIEPKIGKAGRAKLTRIFVVDQMDLKNESTRLALSGILRLHLAKRIGFAVVLEQSLNQLTKKFNIQPPSESAEESPRLDFALFNRDKVVTFFRNESSGGRRFKAILNTNNGSDKNSTLIEAQRAIWVELIGQAWLVSMGFVEDVRGGALSKNEIQHVESITLPDLEKLEKDTNVTAEDEWFPLVVKSESEIEEKLVETVRLFDLYHG